MIKATIKNMKFRNNADTRSNCNCGTCNCNCGSQLISTNIQKYISELTK